MPRRSLLNLAGMEAQRLVTGYLWHTWDGMTVGAA